MKKPNPDTIRKIAWMAASAFLLAGLTAGLWAVFGWPWARIAESASYQWRCVVYLFTGISGNSDGSWAQSAPGSQSAVFAAVQSSLSGIAFVFKAASASLLNKAALSLSALGLADLVSGILQVAVWVPYAALFGYLLKTLALQPEKKDKAGKTKALAFWEGKPSATLRWVSNEIGTYSAWLRENPLGRAFVAAGFASILVFSRLAMSGIDLIAFYLVFTRSLFGASVLPVFAALLATVADDLSDLWWAGDLLIALWIAFLIIRKRALDMLREEQAQNEDEASELAISSIFTGPPGIGKTKMMTSMAIDLEGQMTEKAFGIIRKYAMAFPRFDWPALEAWVSGLMEEETSANRELGEIEAKLKALPSKKGSDGDKAKAAAEISALRARKAELAKKGLVANRAQLRARLFAMFAEYKKSGFDPSLFFGYGAGDGLWWFDGAKEVYLPAAADAYAESFYLYFPGLPLAVMNYAVRFSKGIGGEGFPLYRPLGWYLAGGCKPYEGESQYSAISDFDARRIAKRLDPLDADSWACLDGCVEAYTEIDKERGNKDDYVGIRGRDEPNPTNDGFNWSVKLTRHDFTIDGAPFTAILFDTQRPDSVNADLRESSEDSIYIWERSDTESALPFWKADQAITSWVIGQWMSYYYAFRNARPGVETLYNRALAAVARPFFNHMERMSNSYGFERVTFRHQVGGTGNIAGKAVTEEYYFIRRKTESGIYANDCYRAIGDRRRIDARKGYLDAARYGDIDMTLEEMRRQNSYFIKKLEDETRQSP
jgi:hypothetical protein